MPPQVEITDAEFDAAYERWNNCTCEVDTGELCQTCDKDQTVMIVWAKRKRDAQA